MGGRHLVLMAPHEPPSHGAKNHEQGHNFPRRHVRWTLTLLPNPPQTRGRSDFGTKI